ncbi:MAG TPA: outer membrane protein assembly factor BamE [Burkholderiaceae bacterium]|nr:outer membrane protein assembly factor BamE [Burkholderiaceae bacterium]
MENIADNNSRREGAPDAADGVHDAARARRPLARHATRAFAVAVAIACAGCGSVATTVTGWAPGFMKPYRPDVPQGNIVTQEMVEQLRPGMSQDQVRFLLGTPLLASIFRKDRWDYVYFLRRRDGSTQERRVVVFFKETRLEHFEAGELPPETLADNLILGRKPKPLPAPPPKEPEPQVTLPTSK